jgi:hypothetical protein
LSAHFPQELSAIVGSGHEIDLLIFTALAILSRMPEFYHQSRLDPTPVCGH